MEEKIYCSKCGELIEDDDYVVIGEDFVCSDCVDNYCTTCDRCDTNIWDSDTYGDDYTTLCQYCYDNYYSHCDGCDNLMHNDDLYEYDGDYYCSECYHERKENNYIHEYGINPTQYSLVRIVTDILVLSLKLISEVVIATTQNVYLIEQISRTILYT